MIKTVIFDFDGTIADTFHSAIETINSLASKYGFNKIDTSEIDEFRSKSTLEILKEYHIPLFKLPSLVKDFTTLSQTEILTQHPIKEMPQLVNELFKSDYALNIITSNSVDNVSIFLNKHNMTFFKHIYADKSLLGKNIVISRFLRKYQIMKETVIYVGDEIRDIEAAHKAGIKIIAVTWGFNSEEALNHHFPDYIVNQPKQIAEVLEKINTL